MKQIEQLVPHDSAYDVRVDKVIPRSKDGGAFAQFSWRLPQVPFVEDGVDGNAGRSKEEVQQAQDKALNVLEKETVSRHFDGRSRGEGHEGGADLTRSCATQLLAMDARAIKPWWDVSNLKFVNWRSEVSSSIRLLYFPI